MSPEDGFMSSVKKFGKKLSMEGKRTATLAKLKMDLKTLDAQRKEVSTRLGEKMFDLHRRGVVKDEVLLEHIQEQFDELDELQANAEKLLQDIHDITLMKESTPDPIQEQRVEPELPERTPLYKHTGLVDDHAVQVDDSDDESIDELIANQD